MKWRRIGVAASYQNFGACSDRRRARSSRRRAKAPSRCIKSAAAPNYCRRSRLIGMLFAPPPNAYRSRALCQRRAAMSASAHQRRTSRQPTCRRFQLRRLYVTSSSRNSIGVISSHRRYAGPQRRNVYVINVMCARHAAHRPLYGVESSNRWRVA